jgi:hypothetical protein
MTTSANTAVYVNNPPTGVLTRLDMPLASTAAIKKGNAVYHVDGTFTCSGNADGGVFLGVAEKDVDEAEGDVNCPIDLRTTIPIQYWTNGTSSDAITDATHFQKLVYWKDDHTLTGLKSSRTFPAGVCWGLDPRDSTRVMLEARRFHNNALAQEYGAL